MLKYILFLCVTTVAAFAEVHPLTLRQSVELALKENPDLALSRLDQQKAQAAIRIAKDPFAPKLYAGSGLAKVWGYPTSIEGSAPSIIQTRTDMSLYNKPKRYELARVRETARGAEIDTLSKSDQVAYQTATLFLDAQQLGRSKQSLQLELESLQRVSGAVGVQVQEGRQLPIENKRVAVDLARANRAALRRSAAIWIIRRPRLPWSSAFPPTTAFNPWTKSAPLSKSRPANRPPRNWRLQNNKDIRKLESQLQAKGFEVKEAEAARLPVIDAVAQYALLAKTNYENFFTRFQRNNGELGVSIQIPLLTGSAAKGLASQAQTDILELRTQMGQVRNRIQLDTQKSYQELQKATSAQEVARLDLDYTAIRFRCCWRSSAKDAPPSSRWTMRGSLNRKNGSRFTTRSTRLRTPAWTFAANGNTTGGATVKTSWERSSG